MLSIRNCALEMNWDQAGLFVRLFRFWGIYPRNWIAFFGAFPNDAFELLYDFGQQIPFRCRCANKIGQIRDAALNIPLVVATNMDDAIEDRYAGRRDGWQPLPEWLRVV